MPKKKSSKRNIENPLGTSSRIDRHQNEELPAECKKPKQKPNKKKRVIPLATSSPSRRDCCHLDEKEQKSRDELLAFMESEFEDLKKMYEQAILKIKLSFVDYLNQPYTLDLLSDEELAEVKLLYPKVQLPCVEKKWQVEEDSGISSTPAPNGILKSDLGWNNSNTQQYAGKLESKVLKKVAFNMTSVPEMPEKHLLLRRPVPGERMVSINGSPLVNSDAGGGARLSVTTANGKKLVHIPSSQNRFSQERLPELDPQALEDLSNIVNFINHVLVYFEKK